jgi:raffinose/stachyose/melibiose transport system permease protein
MLTNSRPAHKEGAKSFVVDFLKYSFLALMALFAAFPLLQVFFNSLRSDASVKRSPIGLPFEMKFENYPNTWKAGGYTTAFFNSFFIAAVVIVAVLVLVGFASYALSKLQFRGRDFFVAYFFVAISLPGFLYIVPDYFMLNKLGLVNTRAGLILVYTAGQLPFNLLLLRTFLAGIPRELEEAGKIDGCSETGVFLRITLPIAKPIFLTVALLIFVNVWNEFLWANTFLADDAMKTVATRYVRFVGQYSSNMAFIYTASVITIAPVIVLYLIFSRRFIEGMTSGSVKG